MYSLGGNKRGETKLEKQRKREKANEKETGEGGNNGANLTLIL